MPPNQTKEVANATMAITIQYGGNGKHRRDGDSGYTKSGPSPGESGEALDSSDGSSSVQSTEQAQNLATSSKETLKHGNRPKSSSRIKLHNGRLRVSFEKDQIEGAEATEQEIERFKDFLYHLGKEIFTNENSNS